MSNYMNPLIRDEELADWGAIRIVEDSRYFGIDDLVSDRHLVVKHYHLSDTMSLIYTNDEGKHCLIYGTPDEVVPAIREIWSTARRNRDC